MFTFKPHKLSSSAVSTSGEEGREVGAAVETGFRRVSGGHKEIQPVPSEGDQPWDFFGRNDAKAETPVLWPAHVKS